MDLSEKDIALIEGFLQKTLSSSEQKTVEERIANDPTFAREVELMRDVIAGASDYGRKMMKANLAAMGAKLTATGAIANYEPSKGASSPPKNNASSKGTGGKILSWLLLAGMGIAGWFAYDGGYLDEYIQEGKTILKVDTVRVDSVRKEVIKPVKQSTKRTIRTTRVETTYTYQKATNAQAEEMLKQGYTPGDTIKIEEIDLE